MRHDTLCFALMTLALLSGCVDAGDPPNLQGDPAGDTVTGEDLVSSDAVPDSDAADSLSDVTSAGDSGDVSAEDAGSDVGPSDGLSLDGTPDVTPDVDADAQEPDSGSPECVEAGDCAGALEVCQVFTCEAGLCVIGHADPNDKVSCDDGFDCTTDDLCDLEGVCLGKPSHVACDDLEFCTTDTCEPTEPTAEDGCVNAPVEAGTECTDGNPCTTEDKCTQGTCGGIDKSCDDGKECTADSCDAGGGGCIHALVSVGTGCDAGNLCTTDDTCDADGECALGPTSVPPACDDGEFCTNDACDPDGLEGKGECLTTNLGNQALCDDGDPCTNVDVCLGGLCQGSLLPDGDADKELAPFCDDGNACTLSSCEPNVGCKHVDMALGSACSDGNACTAIDSCKSGVCVPGDTLQCDDPTECLNWDCDSVTGCVSEEIDQGTECDLDQVDGICALAQCDGSGACGVFLHGATLDTSAGQYNASRALSDGGWILVGAVESGVPQEGTTCAIITRLGYDTEVAWQVTPTCDGSPSPTASAAYGVDVFPDGSFAVVGVEQTGPAVTDVAARLWVVGGDGSEVSSHAIGQGATPAPAWDVRVLDDDTLITLLDEPLAAGGASRAVVRRYQTSDTWTPDSVTSDWVFEQTDNEAAAQGIEARRLFDVQPEESTFGLIGSFLLVGDSIKQLIANFSLSTLPATIPAQITYSELSDQGQVILNASDGLYWDSAPGAAAFVAAGSAIYDNVTWSQTNILNANGKLIGAYQIADEHNHTVTRFGDEHLLVVAQHESEGARVHLLDLADVTADVVESDGGLDLLDTLEFGGSTAAYTIACHAEKTCLVAGSSDGAPAWFVFHKSENDTLESCGP